MEDLFYLLRTPSQLPDGTLPLPDAPPAAPTAAAAGAAAGVEGAAGCSSSSGNLGDSSNGSVPGTAQQRQQDKEEQQLAEERRSSNGAASTSGVPANSVAGSAGGTSRGLRLELRDVHFSYPSGSAAGGGRQVLRGVSLEAQPGESIAVVGELPVDNVLRHSAVPSCGSWTHPQQGECFKTIVAMTAGRTGPAASTHSCLSGKPEGPSGSANRNLSAAPACPVVSSVCLSTHMCIPLPCCRPQRQRQVYPAAPAHPPLRLRFGPGCAGPVQLLVDLHDLKAHAL